MIKIALHGVPRSGTTWLGSIFDSSENVAYRHQPLFSYAFKDYLNDKSTKEEIDSFFDDILNTNDEFVLQMPQKKKGLIPVFNKSKITHIVYKEARYHHILENMMMKNPAIKVVGIVRNPKSVISSWYDAPKEFDKEQWDILKEWEFASLKNSKRMENYYGYYKWKDVSTMFLQFEKKYPYQFYLIQYAKLLDNPDKEVKQLFEFCNVTYAPQTEKYINDNVLSLKADFNDAYSVFRSSQTGDKWKKVLPKEIIQKIDEDLRGSELKKFNDDYIYQ